MAEARGRTEARPRAATVASVTRARREKQWRSQKRHTWTRGHKTFTKWCTTTLPASETFTKTTHQRNAEHDTLRSRRRRRAHRIDRMQRAVTAARRLRTAARRPHPPNTKEHLPCARTAPSSSSLILTLALVVPGGALGKRLILDGSTSMLPLVQKLATAYHKAYPKIPAPKVGGGQTAIGITDAASGRVDIGDASRDPIPGVDPQRPRLHEGRPRRRVRDHEHREPRRRTCPSKRSPASSRARSATGARSRARRSPGRSTCSTATAPRVRRTPSRTSSSAKT